jgi:hypothetical protein
LVAIQRDPIRGMKKTITPLACPIAQNVAEERQAVRLGGLMIFDVLGGARDVLWKAFARDCEDGEVFSAVMIDHDDLRFSTFTRDLARRHRRPRSYPPSPARPDALEQLCGGATSVSVAPPSMALLPRFSEEDLSGIDLTDN